MENYKWRKEEKSFVKPIVYYKKHGKNSKGECLENEI